MKRNEILELMNKTFKEEYLGKTYQEVNDLILERIEKAGMMPSWMSLSTGKTLTTEDYESLCMDYDLSTCWEPEE